MLAAAVAIVVFAVMRPYDHMAAAANSPSTPSSDWQPYGLGSRHVCTDSQDHVIADVLGPVDSAVGVMLTGTDAQNAQCTIEQVRVYRRHRWWWDTPMGPTCLGCSESLH